MRLRLILPVLAAAIGLAAPAHADDDLDFLADLDNAGIHYGDRAQAVTAGKTVCSLKDEGMTDDEVVTNLTEQNPGFVQDRAVTFETIASDDYCPPASAKTTESSD